MLHTSDDHHFTAPARSYTTAFRASRASRGFRKTLWPGLLLLLLSILSSGAYLAADEPATKTEADKGLESVIASPILGAEDSLLEVQRFCDARIARMPEVSNRAAWQQEAERLRRAVLDKVVFRGAAANWRKAETRVEWLETIEGGAGYRIKKLRYEALPGLWIPALLYEPLQLSSAVPAVMNVNGHDGQGKAASYKQIRCINQAKRGMLALNVEWLGMGQLRHENFRHYRMNQLDLCGTSGLALHYLAMRRGLDVLLSHPHADPRRVAVAGLSGGGWQTIFISSLDTRVTLANPVAGYSSYRTRVYHQSDLGDSEQTPVDLAAIADYTHLTAMMAPRATLLTYNAEDNCCFAAPHALQPLREAAEPAFAAWNASDKLRHHVNHDPGTHNFERDNREALYRMLRDHFADEKAKFDPKEIECDAELKSYEQLSVDLPEDNLDFHQLALRLSESLPRQASLPDDPTAARKWQAEQRGRLRRVVHLIDSPAQAQLLETKSHEDLTVRRWKLRVGEDWTVPVVELAPAQPRGTTLLLSDQGRKAACERARELLDAGQRVLLADVFYLGESKIAGRDFLYALLVSSVGERPLGIQAGQVAALARWLSEKGDSQTIHVEADGPRTSLVALVAAACEPEAIGHLRLGGSYGSLREIIESNGSVDQTPELFCFGLLEAFDIRQLAALVAPRPVQFVAPTDRARRELNDLAAWYQTLGREFQPLAE